MTWAIVAGVGTSLVGGSAQSSAAGADRRMQERNLAQSRGDLEPYREFGYGQLEDFQNWLGSPEGQYRDPTMEEVTGGQGYKTRLGAIENSAAMRGGLLSGNALRDIGEFGASEFEAERGRRQSDYMNEYNRRMSRLNLGYGAAGGSAGLTSAATSGMSGTYTQQGNAMSDMAGAVAGGFGAYQGQQNFNKYMDRAYPRKSGNDTGIF